MILEKRKTNYLWFKSICGVFILGLFVFFLCFAFCTRETVVKIGDMHWEHTVVLQELHEHETCGFETTIDFNGDLENVYRCKTYSSWDEVNSWVHQGDNFHYTSWPSDPIAGFRQRIQHYAEYVIKVYNDKGKWKHSTSNLPWARKFKYNQLWLANVNRAGMAWPKRQVGAEEQ